MKTVGKHRLEAFYERGRPGSCRNLDFAADRELNEDTPAAEAFREVDWSAGGAEA